MSKVPEFGAAQIISCPSSLFALIHCRDSVYPCGQMGNHQSRETSWTPSVRNCMRSAIFWVRKLVALPFIESFESQNYSHIHCSSEMCLFLSFFLNKPRPRQIISERLKKFLNPVINWYINTWADSLFYLCNVAGLQNSWDPAHTPSRETLKWLTRSQENIMLGEMNQRGASLFRSVWVLAWPWRPRGICLRVPV